MTDSLRDRMSDEKRQLNAIHWIVWINLLLTAAVLITVLVR